MLYPKTIVLNFIIKNPNKKHAIPETDATTARSMKGFIFIILFTVIFSKLSGFFLAQDSLLLYYLTYNHYAKQWDGVIWYTKAVSNWFVGLICWWFDTLRVHPEDLRPGWKLFFYIFSRLFAAWNMKYKDFYGKIFILSVRKIGCSKMLILSQIIIITSKYSRMQRQSIPYSTWDDENINKVDFKLDLRLDGRAV